MRRPSAILLCALFTAVMFPALAQNPYLPLWEHIPDGEPHVFEDPDRPGCYRVYVYGSHDNLITEYCGRDQVVWSAPVDDLTAWRLDGVIFEHEGDVLYAPDVCEVRDPVSGKKTYYLYPNNQNNMGMIARSDRPDGPFRPCNLKEDRPWETYGVTGFDPAVLVDDDGRVYAYWGFGHSFAAEMDPATMCTVKPGTEIVDGMVSGHQEPGIFRFFEASSIRKIGDKYVFIYSRVTEDGEFGLGSTNGTLAYAYGDHPLGPFTYGGTIIDARARETDEAGNPVFTTIPNGNTHGSLAEIGGKWYVFYHRHTGTDEYSRQAMVAPVSVSYEEGPGGRVSISEGEYTSEGFRTEGLDPLTRWSAGIACWTTGPEPARQEWPKVYYPGSHVAVQREVGLDHNPVINNTDGSIVGYRYFNFDAVDGPATLCLEIVPEGVDGSIEIMADSPWESRGGMKLGGVAVSAASPKQLTTLKVPVPAVAGLSGKHALYLVFNADKPAASLCELHYLQFMPGIR